MTLALTQSAYAVAARCVASFAGTGGVEPYAYSVAPGGAGGSVNPTTGAYTAPLAAQSEGAGTIDTIVVTDSAAATASAQILVGLPLLLLCDIIQREMGLAAGRVYIWNQKLRQPDDYGVYVAVSVPSSKSFGNANRFDGDTNSSEQYLSVSAVVALDVISRGPAARDRKEEVLLALGSDYAKFQQTANSFGLAKQAQHDWRDLSGIDGAAIPYRYQISIRMQYAFVKTTAVQYYDEFEEPTLTTEP